MPAPRKLALITAVSAAGSLLMPQHTRAIALNADGTYSQNFSTMGTVATASLPPGWVVVTGTASPNYTAGTTKTNFQASALSPSNGSGGTYNWGSSATDRALGFMTDGTFASPNSAIVKLDNTTGSTVTEFDFSYDIKRFRINTAAAQVNLFVSLDGINWTPDSSGDTGPFSTGPSSYNYASGTVVHKSVTLSDLSIANGASYYIRWNFDTTGGNSQALGLDNLLLTSVLTAALPANLIWSPSDPATATWSTLPTPQNWTNTAPAAASFNNGDSVNFTDSGLANGSGISIANGVTAGTVTFSHSAGTYFVSGATLTASGALSISGGGTVLFSNTVSPASTTVTSGTLAGTGVFTTSVTLGGTRAALVPATVGVAGTISMASLALQGSTILMDLATPGTSDLIAVSGNLTLSGANLITLNNLPGFVAGIYTLIEYTGPTPGTLTNLGLTSANVGGKYAYLVNNTANTSIDVVIQDVATSSSHTFTGGPGGTSNSWLSAANWNDNNTPGTTDIAIFNSGGPSGAISIDFSAATNNGLKNQAVGAIRLTSSPDRTITSIAADGTLTLNGINGELLTNSSPASTLTLANAAVKLTITLGSVGTVEVTNTPATINITSDIAGPGGINKTGQGLLTLSGNNSYSSGTTITAGTLLANSATSSLGAGSTTIRSGATLGGTGIVMAPVTVSAEGIINPGALNAVGTLTLSDLTLNAARLDFDISDTSTDRLNTAALTLTGASTFKLTKIGSSIPANTFTLLHYAGAPLANLSSFTLDASTLPTDDNYSLINNTANHSIDLLIVPSANQLTWDGAIDGTWSTSGAANWKGHVFSNGKAVTFDDTGSPGVAVTTAVSPASITFNNSSVNYNLTNTTGSIAGPTSLTKTGAATLIISGYNSYTGGTTINGGTLLLHSVAPALLPTAASGPSVVLNTGGTLALAPTATPHAAAYTAASTFFSLAGGKFNLSNNDLLISGGAASASAFAAALLPPTSNGTSLVTTGIMTGTDWNKLHAPGSPFDNITTIAPTDLLLRYGYAGDANFDGKIDIDDYLLIDRGYLTGATDYTHGNFDHSPGPVNAADYAIIDFNAANLSGTLASSEIALHTAEFGAPYTNALSALLAPVPEPASLTLLALAAAPLLQRRRR